jgi:hypothetical protein
MVFAFGFEPELVIKGSYTKNFTGRDFQHFAHFGYGAFGKITLLLLYILENGYQAIPANCFCRFCYFNICIFHAEGFFKLIKPVVPAIQTLAVQVFSRAGF